MWYKVLAQRFLNAGYVCMFPSSQDITSTPQRREAVELEGDILPALVDISTIHISTV